MRAARSRRQASRQGLKADPYLVGHVVVSTIPYVSLGADARDILATGRNLVLGDGGWVPLAIAVVGIVPLGDLVKFGRLGDDAVALGDDAIEYGGDAISKGDAAGKSGGPGSGLTRQTRAQLLGSQATYQKLLLEHRQKLADYQANPMAHDNLGLLKNAPSDKVRQMMIEGRIKVLEGQIAKHEGELAKIRTLLGE